MAERQEIEPLWLPRTEIEIIDDILAAFAETTTDATFKRDEKGLEYCTADGSRQLNLKTSFLSSSYLILSQDDGRLTTSNCEATHYGSAPVTQPLHVGGKGIGSPTVVPS